MSQSHPLEGTVLGVYEIRELIGRGGMGEVHRAPTRGSGARWRSSCWPERRDERFRERLLHESRLAAASTTRTSSPSTTRARRRPAVHRDALRRRRRPQGAAAARGPLDPARTVAIAAQVADALDAAHRARAGPPRRQAEQRPARPPGRPRALLSGRLRTHAQRASGADPPTRSSWARRLRRARAGPRRAARRAGRPVRARLPALRVPHRLPPFRRAPTSPRSSPTSRSQPRPHERDDGCPPRSTRCSRGGWPRTRRSASTAVTRSSRRARRARAGRARRAAAPLRRLRARARAAALAAAALAIALGRRRDRAAAATGALTRIDPRTNQVAARTPATAIPAELAVTPGGIWMADFRGGVLWRYEPAAGPASG